MRETWLIHLCTDWMGDDAWLWKLDCEFRKFNFVGDTQWLRGAVTRKYLADGQRPAVDLDIRAENQRGELTTPGHATVLLPSRSTARSGCPTRRAAGRISQVRHRGDRRRVLAAMSAAYAPSDGLGVSLDGDGICGSSWTGRPSATRWTTGWSRR